MRFEQLEYLVSVAETKSMTNTAERLFVTQQAVSNSLKNLKNELNVELFVRNNQGLQLTKEGEIAVAFAKTVLEAKCLMEQQLEQVKNGDTASEKVVLHVISTSRILNSLVPKIAASRNKNKLQSAFVQEADFFEMFESLRQGTADVGLVSINQSEYEDRIHTISLDDYCVDVIEKDTLVMVLHTKYFEEFRNVSTVRLDVLLNSQNHVKKDCVQAAFGHIGTSRFQHLLDETPSFHRVNDLEFCRNLLMEEKSIVYMPQLAYKLFFKNKKYMQYKIEDDKAEVVHLAIYRKENQPMVQFFVDALKLEIKKLK